MKPSLIHVDPTVPFGIGFERLNLITRQTDEIITGILTKDPQTFVNKAADLQKEIATRIAEIKKSVAKVDLEIAQINLKISAAKNEKDKSDLIAKFEDQALEWMGLETAKIAQEARRQTTEQLLDEQRTATIKAAVQILKNLHDAQMSARTKHWSDTCQFGTCEKKPVKRGKHGRREVFCAKHRGTAVSATNHKLMLADPLLRIIAE